MSERCPACFNFQRYCNCAAVLEAERIVAAVQFPWLDAFPAARRIELPPTPYWVNEQWLYDEMRRMLRRDD